MSTMHAWDAALMQVLPNYYNADASPQTLYRIKRDIVARMRQEHGMTISKAEERHIRVEWRASEPSVNLVVPPHLLTRVLH